MPRNGGPCADTAAAGHAHPADDTETAQMSYPPPPPEHGDDGGREPGASRPDEPTAPYSGAGSGNDYPPPGYGSGNDYPPPGYGPAPYGPPPGYGYPPPPTNGKATASLIVGVASLVLSWCCGAGVLGVVAIVLGVRARSELRASSGRQSGDGLALAGIITGSLAVLVGLAAIAVIILALASGGYSTSYGR